MRRDGLRLFRLGQFGSVEKVFISRESSGHHKGFAFVTFAEVFKGARLFGEHRFNGKVIEVKRNLHNLLCVSGLAGDTTAEEVRGALDSAGFLTAEVIMGQKNNGIPVGSACVRLMRDEQLPQAAAIGRVTVGRSSMAATLSIKLARNASSTQGSNGNTPVKVNKRRQFDGEAQTFAGLYMPASLASVSTDFTESTEGFVKGLFHSVTGLSEADSSPLLGLPHRVLALDSEGSRPRKLSSQPRDHHLPEKHRLGLLPAVHDETRLDLALHRVEEPTERVLASHRTNSECLPDIKEASPLKPLSMHSTSFYSSANAVPLSAEVRVTFYTFPGRE